MTARPPCLVIDLASRRAAQTDPPESSPEYLRSLARDLVNSIAAARPDLSHDAHCSLADMVVSQSISYATATEPPPPPPLAILPDDPVYALFDAHKEARDKYQRRVAEIARGSGRSLKSTAARIFALRRSRSE